MNNYSYLVLQVIGHDKYSILRVNRATGAAKFFESASIINDKWHLTWSQNFFNARLLTQQELQIMQQALDLL